MSGTGDRTAAFLNRFAQSRAVRSPAASVYGELPVPANSFYASDVLHSRRSPQQTRRARGGGAGSSRPNRGSEAGPVHDRLVEEQVQSLMEHSNRRNSVNTKGRLRYGHVKRSSHFDRNPGYTPGGAPDIHGAFVEDHSSDYWAMHLELQNATQENHKLTAQVAEEIPALKAQLVAAETKAAAATKAMLEEHAAKVSEVEAALTLETEQKRALAVLLDEARNEHKKTLENAMMVKATMEKKYQTLVETARRQRKRAEDTQTSGERLHAMAQTALEQAAIQAQTSEFEVEAMRESLRMAQGYQLHTVLMRVQAQAENREKKLTRMISHLQAEKVALRKNLTEVSKDRERLFQKLRVRTSSSASSVSPTTAAAASVPLERRQQRTATKSQFEGSSGGKSASTFLSGSPSLMALAASADPVYGVAQTAELEDQIKSLAVKNSALAAQLHQEKSNVSAVQKELSQTREMARNMSNQMSAMGKTPPSKSTTAAAAPTSARAKTRGALLAGLRSGKLAKAVDAMDEAGGPEGALALQNQETAKTKALGKKPQSARSKTRGALLAGLRNGKLAKAVDAMDSAGGPPSSQTVASSAKRNTALVPLRAGNGDVMAVQVRRETDRAGKVQETSIPIRSGNGDIMAVQLQKSVVQGVTVSDEGKFPRGDKIEPVVGQGGDLLAVRVSTRTEKDLSPKKGMVAVRDAQGSVMAVRVT